MPRGGLARRASAIKKYAGLAQGTLLIMDAGSALSGQYETRVSEGRMMVEAMDAMGYDAMGIGYFDTLLGPEALLQRAAEADMALVCANLVAADTQELYLPPYVILERDGARFGILGLTNDFTATAPGFAEAAAVTDATEAARRYVAELQGQVDVVIVLSLLGLEADMTLAEAVPGINVIIGGNNGRLMQMPTRVGNTLIVQQGYNGEYMGMLRVTLDETGAPRNEAEIMIALGQDYPDDPEMVALMDKWAQLIPTPTPSEDGE